MKVSTSTENVTYEEAEGNEQKRENQIFDQEKKFFVYEKDSQNYNRSHA